MDWEDELRTLRLQVRSLQQDLDEVKRLVRRLAGLPEKEMEITWGGKKEDEDD